MYQKCLSLDLQLVNVGEEVLLFYNDRQSFQTLVSHMQSEEMRNDENSVLNYHINLVQLLALCTEGKNVYTEIKCHSLLPLDDIVRVVTHKDCIPEVKILVYFYLFACVSSNTEKTYNPDLISRLYCIQVCNIYHDLKVKKTSMRTYVQQKQRLQEYHI